MVYKISALNDKVVIDSNVGMQLPRGTTGERPAATTAGIIRYNTTSNSIEVSDGGTWSALSGGGGGGTVTTRWEAEPDEAGCPIYVELTNNGFEAYTQNSHIGLGNSGYWDIGSNFNATGIFGEESDVTLYSNRGNAIIRTGDSTKYFTFDIDGNLTLPVDGSIFDSDGNDLLVSTTGDITFDGIQIIGAGSSGELNSGSIELVPDINYYGNGTYLIVEPGVPNHIHLKPGSNGGDDIRILLGDRNHLSISDVTDTIAITSNVGAPTKFIGFINNSGTDDFNAIPGDTLHVISVISGAITDGMTIYCEETLPPEGVVVNFGNVTGTNGTGGPGTYQIPGESISMNQQMFYAGSPNPIKTWVFGNTGELTLPNNGTINYIPATSSDWAGTAPTTIQEALDRIASAIKAINSTGA